LRTTGHSELQDTGPCGRVVSRRRQQGVREAIQNWRGPIRTCARASSPEQTADVATRDKLLDRRFELKQVLTAGEWLLVYPERQSQPKN